MILFCAAALSQYFSREPSNYESTPNTRRRPFGMRPFYRDESDRGSLATEFPETRAKTTRPRKKRRDAVWYIAADVDNR